MTRMRLRRLLGPGVRAALLLVGLSPFLPLLVGKVPVLHWLSDAVSAWFAFQCHRDPARSLTLLAHTLPVCSRCFGIYVGLGLGALFLRPRLGVWPLRIWVAVAAVLMVVDVWTESLGLRPPSLWLRTLTGVLLAYPVGDALVWAARNVSSGSGAEAAGEGQSPYTSPRDG
jgi:uncharacterized membrane protein